MSTYMGSFSPPKPKAANPSLKFVPRALKANAARQPRPPVRRPSLPPSPVRQSTPSPVRESTPSPVRQPIPPPVRQTTYPSLRQALISVRRSSSEPERHVDPKPVEKLGGTEIGLWNQPGEPWNLPGDRERRNVFDIAPEEVFDKTSIWYTGPGAIDDYVFEPLPELPPAPKHIESLEEYKEYLANRIGQMMFVSGETAEPSTETTWLIEEIVREQVIHMVSKSPISATASNLFQLKVAVDLANRRGSKSINIHDLMFQIRHDKSKLSRLKTFLSWKDVRKNVKDSDDKGGGGDADIDIDADGAQAPTGGGPAQKSNKKQKLVLPWDVESFYAVQVPERDDEEDEEEDEQNEATLARLAFADERTRNMTREEYVYWSDCRQASFTFRKGKRFREWAGFGTIVDTKPNDDVIDILGFLTFEIVQTLTETALKVKSEQDTHNRRITQGQGENKKRKREVCSLFSMHEEGRTPIEPAHVREAFRRLQIPPPKYLMFQVGVGGMRRPYQLI